MRKRVSVEFRLASRMARKLGYESLSDLENNGSIADKAVIDKAFHGVKH